MCAISGLLHADGQPIDLAPFVAATNLVSYRGPDDSGFAFFGPTQGEVPLNSQIVPKGSGRSVLALGHRRLSILDLSDRGRQPMKSHDGRYYLVFNGEIYNYLELRETLRSLGHTFETSTDSEVLLKAYEHWGRDCLKRFNGMWAFAIWDSFEESLFLARDRFGVKPLYFSRDQGSSFAFGSEIKQLLHLGFGSGRAQFSNSARFLQTGRSDDTRETMFEGIFRLLPGEFAICRSVGSKIDLQIESYHRLSENPEPIGKEDWLRGLGSFLEDSVRLRLRADVVAGSCLSGGVDSSSIVCLVHKVDERFRQATFTSRFEDSRFDEFQFASEVISKVGAISHTVFPDLDRLLGEDLDRLIWHQDEPFVSTSIYAQWKVMETASHAGVKVLLDGQGGDEIFAGYDRYVPSYLAGSFLRANPIEAAQRILGMRKSGTLDHLPALWRLVGSSISKAAGIKSRRNLLGGIYRPLSEAEEQPEGADLKSQMKFDLYHSMQALLRFEDRNSMAHSIEARTPFLDYRLVEWAMMGKEEWFYEGGVSKAPLRSAMAGIVPEKLLLRRDKMGFVTPEFDFYERQEDHLKGHVLKKDSPLWNWMDRDGLSNYISQNGLRKSGFAPWRWYVFDRWMSQFGLSA